MPQTGSSHNLNTFAECFKGIARFCTGQSPTGPVTDSRDRNALQMPNPSKLNINVAARFTDALWKGLRSVVLLRKHSTESGAHRPNSNNWHSTTEKNSNHHAVCTGHKSDPVQLCWANLCLSMVDGNIYNESGSLAAKFDEQPTLSLDAACFNDEREQRFTHPQSCVCRTPKLCTNWGRRAEALGGRLALRPHSVCCHTRRPTNTLRVVLVTAKQMEECFGNVGLHQTSQHRIPKPVDLGNGQLRVRVRHSLQLRLRYFASCVCRDPLCCSLLCTKIFRLT